MEEGNGFTLFIERWRALTKEQRISVGILGVCGMIALVLSVQRIRAGILNPFTVTTAKFQTAKQTVGGIDAERVKEEESKRRDTDGDGLSDYDEERVYGTSPYLADTDGDGTLDHTELALGSNPTCPKGQTCAAPVLDVLLRATSSALEGPVDLTSIESGVGDKFYADFQRGINEKKGQIVASTGSTSTMLQADLIRDPAEIRRVIQESGKVDQATLDAITDEQLLQLYDQARAELANQGLEGVSPSDVTP